MKDTKRNQSFNLYKTEPDKADKVDDEETFFVASSCECTGLIPSLPSSEEEVESYMEIYRIPDQGSKDNFKPMSPQ